MEYCADGRIELKVVDEEGLKEAIIKEYDIQESNIEDMLGNLFRCYSVERKNDWIYLETAADYNEDDYEFIAPYVEGTGNFDGIDFIDIWNLVFHNRKLIVERPTVIYPSDAFYIEQWTDSDICNFTKDMTEGQIEKLKEIIKEKAEQRSNIHKSKIIKSAIQELIAQENDNQ